MDNELEKIRQKLLDVFDENIEYTQEDFDNEFNHNSSFTTTTDFLKIQIPYTNISSFPLVNSDNGFVIHASTKTPITIPEGVSKLIPSGLSFNLPRNFEIQIRPHQRLIDINTVIMTGIQFVSHNELSEIKVNLFNHGDDIQIYDGSPIGIGIISSVLGNDFIQLVKKK